MAKNYWTCKRDEGWGVKAEGSKSDISLFSKQSEAWDFTRDLAQKSQGEAFLQGRDGKIRERNTYGHDPRDIKG